MFGRVNQLLRHLSYPLPNYTHSSTAASRAGGGALSIMTSSSAAAILDRSRRTISTAACLIIGDEVLGGKTIDTNSPYFANWCFSLGIQLKKIEVIADDEDEIAEAVRRMSERYDFVVTSGGIGPTHDDITYQSIAKAFNLPLKLHSAAFERMKRLSRPHPSQAKFDWDTPSPALTAKLRMVQLPFHAEFTWEDQSVFPLAESWVPIAIVNGNVYILPGVPGLFQGLLDGLRTTAVVQPRLAHPDGSGSLHRILFSTPLSESLVAEYLTQLAARVEPRGIKVGSYPRWGKKRNTVTLVGAVDEKDFMESLVPVVEKNVSGRRVMTEGEDDPPSDTETKTTTTSTTITGTSTATSP